MRANAVDRLTGSGKVSADRFVFLRRARLECFFQQRLRAAVVSVFEIDAEQHQGGDIAQRDVVDRGAHVFQFGGGGLKLMNRGQRAGTFNPA